MALPFWLLIGLLAGSIPFGVVIARSRGVDIQQVGSGNIGATNVARSVGKGWGGLVLLLDAAKGAGPVALSSRQLLGWGVGPSWLPMAVGLAAVVGHCFCPWLRFRGGKGVATALGVFLVIDPVATLFAILIFAVVFFLTRAVSAGSLLAALALPAMLALRHHTWIAVALAVALALVIWWRHRDNLRRLRSGTERGV